jgi:hypothetical protein
VLLTTLIFATVLAMVKSWGRIPRRPDSRSPTAMSLAVVSGLDPHTRSTVLEESIMTATYTFDVFSSLDGYGPRSRPNWTGFGSEKFGSEKKVHTREGDAIAAARRRRPMVEVDPQTPLIGADGKVPLIDIFDGRSQLIAYFHMWHTGRPAAEQCEGCTFNTSR